MFSTRSFIYSFLILIFFISIFYFTNGKLISAEDNSHTDNAKMSSDKPNQENAMPVEVYDIKAENTQLWFDYSGRTSAINFAEVKPQVAGIIEEIKFEDGSRTNQGDILFIIDPRPFEAKVNFAKANLEAAKAELNLAKKELTRAKDLLKSNAIAQKTLDSRENNFDLAKAKVASLEAELNQAKLNLDYAFVKAPISGKLGRAEIKEGNFIQTSPNAPTLTTIVSDENLYVDFEIDEKTFFQRIKANENKDLPVKISSLYFKDKNFNGTIDSFDNQIDLNTGTIRVRAIVANEDSYLIPGMFVNVSISTNNNQKIISVPQTAIGTDQDRKFVWLINNENKTEYRQVTLGKDIGQKRVITEGLKEGDKIVANGVIKIRPNILVTDKANIETPKN